MISHLIRIWCPHKYKKSSMIIIIMNLILHRSMQGATKILCLKTATKKKNTFMFIILCLHVYGRSKENSLIIIGSLSRHFSARFFSYLYYMRSCDCRDTHSMNCYLTAMRRQLVRCWYLWKRWRTVWRDWSEVNPALISSVICLTTIKSELRSGSMYNCSLNR